MTGVLIAYHTSLFSSILSRVKPRNSPGESILVAKCVIMFASAGVYLLAMSSPVLQAFLGFPISNRASTQDMGRSIHGSVAVATLQTLDAQPTQSGLRIGSGREADEVGLGLDDGKQCFSALPSLKPHPALLCLLFASVAGDAVAR